MKRKNHWVLFAILLLALINLSPSEETAQVLSDNDGDVQPMTPPQRVTLQEKGHIQVAVQMDESDFLYLQKMNQQFMEDHLIQVELVNIPPEKRYATYQKEQLKLGNSPDVLLLDNGWIRRFAADGYLLPTESYFSGSLSGEVLSASLTPNEWNGYVWGVPMDTDPYVYVYNPTLLKQYGIEHPPDSAEAWGTLFALYHKQPFAQHLLALNFDDPNAVMTLLWQMGGGLKPGEQDGSLFAMTGELQNSLQRLEQIRPILWNARLASTAAEDLWNQFYNGDVAFILTKASEAKKHQFPRASISFPKLKQDRMTTWIGGRSYVVSSQTQNPEAAGLWISAMTSQQNQLRWYEFTGNLPVIKTIYYDPDMSDLPKWVPASLPAGSGISMPAEASLPRKMEKFSKLSESFLNGSMTLKQFKESLGSIGK
ncbi:extracellular solute-binding protein [Paenibacillus puldeungensis]|uniref:Extracellular solute-binding protein n=1 Tax=Paenibacillus puldeungensis TaxID=696536 RepID=A0ABW3RUG3_9BACL